ncbi:MAG TPA: class I SAM-dependent methyltransferase [Candidatus Paceibacterota bacterium]|nr:class I SAM-dependent methyltransferase [Candidatus Paceibacterota bacterium]
MDVQVPEGYYLTEKYASLERFISYFYQIKGIRQAAPESLLFIGVGDGVVPSLVRKSISMTTFDFDVSLRPDVVGDVRSIELPDRSFDAVCIYEVLEHLPFDEMKKALAELARVSKRTVLLSVPHRRTGFEFVLKFPGMRSLLKRSMIDLAFRWPVRFPGFAISTQHHWEIDGHTTTLAQFRAALSEHFDIVAEQTPVLDTYHRFFTLRVRPHTA